MSQEYQKHESLKAAQDVQILFNEVSGAYSKPSLNKVLKSRQKDALILLQYRVEQFLSGGRKNPGKAKNVNLAAEFLINRLSGQNTHLAEMARKNGVREVNLERTREKVVAEVAKEIQTEVMMNLRIPKFGRV